MADTLERFKKQHFENYKNAICEIVKNNSEALFSEDVMSLLKKPPLDSMDSIKVKFLDLARKNLIVLKNSELDSIIDDYRDEVILVCEVLKEYRIKCLLKKLEGIDENKFNDIIKFSKKDFSEINKNNRKILKEKILDTFEKKIVNNVNKIFTDNVDNILKNDFTSDMSKFINKVYIKQICESVDFKVLVKDTILISLVKEQGDRYIFTLENSRIFN
ncbi:MAG: hypothetical protein PUB18_00120 [bacterium]|nr:hypothetical protein [bacterium]